MMKNSKKGSSSVFLVMVMATLFAIIFALIAGARNEYIKSRGDAIINLAGDSVLSEFDTYVQKEYGLFLLGGHKSKLNSKLRSYVDYSISGMDNVKDTSTSINGSGYSIANNEYVKEQIISHMRYGEVSGILDKFMKASEKKNDMEYETLRNGATIVSLPTYNMPKTSLTTKAKYLAENLTEAKTAFQTGSDKYLMNRYILKYFNNMAYKTDGNHFFRNEAEYILGGELSDHKNEKRVEMAIVAMRFPLNLAYLYSDKEKMAALLALAEILTPEAAPATQLVLAATWAYAESDNDVKLLWDGSKVPLTKDKSTWAVDMDSAINGLNTGIFRPDKEKGQTYSDYLQIMLYFLDDEVKTARVMDLIQINTRMNNDSDFVIEEHCCGFHMSVGINRRNFSYEKKY